MRRRSHQAPSFGEAPALPAVDVINESSDHPAVDLPTALMIKKLNVLVGTLREAGHITTEQIYRAMERDPSGYSEVGDGELHWSPLRDSLTKAEAHALIERLTALEERVAAVTA